VRGAKLTARLVKDRLDRELIGNVSMRILPTERPDAWEVQGRGELQLADPRRADAPRGLRADRRQAAGGHQEIDGKLHEPVERLTIDTPEEHLGAITQLLAARKGRMEQMTNHGTGWVRMEFLVPSRGLIGFRTEFLTETRGTGIMHHVFEGYEPWFGEITSPGSAAPWSPTAPGRSPPTRCSTCRSAAPVRRARATEVYEGMIVGENSRADDMDVNITKEKKLTNVRAPRRTISRRSCPRASSRSSSPWSSAARTSASR
jgi:GTP-binding protein